ncbi:MAG TPA: hypothetical protein VNX60_05075 [Candidatus Acidoferrum sp.]|jgi:hypothetical protein|nr:hypothetical protein [Candidatus Acidoferrum sp.]
MRKEINWRDASTLTNLSAFQAMQVLAEISAAFRQSTIDAGTHDALGSIVRSIDASDEAKTFADACNSLGRKIRSAKDCRPGLRQAADQKRDEARKLTADEEAAEFAANARAYHRR